MNILFEIVTAILLSWGLYVPVRRIALHYGIVDHPNVRRLNKKSVPVMGGVTIFSAAIVCTLFFDLYTGTTFYVNIAVMLMAMLALGLEDDRRDIRWTIKTLIELLIFWGLMKWSGILVGDFHGLWGIDELPVWISWGFTFLFFVGVTNGVNLMDGIDGLSSGYGLMATFMFGLYFWGKQLTDFAIPSFSIFGAIIPFWFYNVFSRRKKMFMGDAGSLTLGLILAIFAIRAINIPDMENGIMSYALAILAIPVFDTLRVMAVRIINGRSPMAPDKSHLHHIFIDLGFGHLRSSMIVISLNFIVVASWWICELTGCSINTQFYIVFAAGLVVTWGVYYLFSYIRQCRPERWAGMQNWVRRHPFGKTMKSVITKIVDGK